MADAAVEFLLENLKQLLLHHANLIKDAKNLLEKLENDLRLFKAFLRDSAKKRRKDEKLRELVRQIQNVVYEAEDIIDAIVTQAAEDKSRNYFLRAFQNRSELTQQVETVCSKIRDIYGDKSRADFAFINVEDGEPDKIEAPILRKDNVVGFEDEAETLMRYLGEETEHLDVISIIGMPGLGKTTLAGKIYHDSNIQYMFPVRMWIYVSQEFTRKDIFLSILKELGIRVDSEIKCKTDGELAELVSGHLMNGKFLLVMDDVWTAEDWNKLKIALPTNNKKGKVLITSRQKEVALCANQVRVPHMLRFLTPDESWLLLRYEVFGNPEFPPELEVEGKQIANQCQGLPLAIVVIGGILVKKFSASGEMGARRKAWRKVSESFNTYLKDHDTEKRMEKIISLSYEKLPYHLRECFLYVGMFPEDFEIPAWKLIRMWIAEGLIQQKENVTLEETAENYLDDLINRNLVRADKFKPDGRVKTFRIHDLLRDFCRTEAGNEKENFFQEIKMSSDGGFQPSVSEGHKYRRLCIHSNVLNFLSEKPHGPSVRSFVCFSNEESPIQSENISSIPAGFKLLRVLDIKPIKFDKLPTDMYQLLHLRYIVFSFSKGVLPPAFSKLWNLQTLIVDTTCRTLDIKVDILNMIQLRHFKTNRSATLSKTNKSNKGGEKLQTLGSISPKSCTQEVFDRTRNLKKLGVRGQLALILDDKSGSFDSFEKLGNLVKLKLVNDLVLCSSAEQQLHSLPPAYKFPTQLRSLTLCDTSLDWRHMSVLGSLDKLEVLKLKDKAFWGTKWEATDGGFRHLEVLHIGRTNLENWVASHHHFPKLNRLELRNCENLKEIPIGLASIPTFQLLDLHRSWQATVSAKEIRGIKRSLEEQQVPNVRRFKLSIFPPED
ncbi:hypothetical protein ACS0TY_031219 [Phlomoides rotata]